MVESEKVGITNLEIQLNEYEQKIYKLEKGIKNPYAANLIFALTTSMVLNFAANLHDHYTVMEYIKFCLSDVPLFMPVGCIVSYFVYELNKEKKDEIDILNNKIKELKEEQQKNKLLIK